MRLAPALVLAVVLCAGEGTAWGVEVVWHRHWWKPWCCARVRGRHGMLRLAPALVRAMVLCAGEGQPGASRLAPALVVAMVLCAGEGTAWGVEVGTSTGGSHGAVLE